jgi:hypothetical protein
MFGDTKRMAEAIVGDPPAAPAGDDDGKTAAAQQLIDAVQAGDAAGVVVAMKAMFDLLESEPHEEAEQGEED